ncbi:hypothetical protein ACO1O0_006460 [Amphichorda felina]
MTRLALGALLCSLVTRGAAVDPIEVAGNKFFNKDGSQFFIKGVSYQLRPDDPLVDTEQCRRDVKLMKELGANALRVYHVDADADHDGCMETFADAGIYLLIDLDTFDTYITPHDRFAQVMDAFEKYGNVLAFFVGNENIAKKEDSTGAPFIKAAVRDMKAYRDSKGYRKIPIGYSAADIKELRPMLQDYLTCGGNSSETVDFFGLNSYSWCDPSTYEQSSYRQLQEHAKDFPVPIFLTETGCNVPGPRLWGDQEAVFGEDMASDWSGAIVYEWIQEQNGYGIVSYGPPVGDPGRSDESVFDNWTRRGTPTPVSPDFGNLKTRWADARPTGVSRGEYDPEGHVSTRACPTSTEGGWWQVDGDVRLPALDETMTAPSRLAAAATTSTVVEDDVAETVMPTRGVPGGHNRDDTGNKDGGDDYSGQERYGIMLLALCFAVLIQVVAQGVWL